MRMSVFAYVSLAMAACTTIMAYFLSADAKLALTMLPMLLLLGGIPALMDVMNRRHVGKLDLRHVKLGRIKDLTKKGIGEQVRICGTIAAISHKWLNKPRYHVVDASGEIGVYMFVPPKQSICCGDQIEVVGTLRWSFGLGKKEKRLWGLTMEKLS